MSEHPQLPALQLKKREERRLRAGHLWVYSNEVDTQKTPLKDFEPGQAARVLASNGDLLGTGYVNPQSLICARLLNTLNSKPADTAFLEQRIRTALALRERVYSEPYYRMVYAESDLLPGLVVDRYNDVLVVQITTAGMDVLRDSIIEALNAVVSPAGILLRNDGSMRALEGLDSYVEKIGNVPDELIVVEDGLQYNVSIAQGQKTGWFYDQRDNRRKLSRYVKDARVLDVFSYAGGWGLHAANYGAREVVCVDASEDAVNRITANAQLNNFADRVSALQGDAFDCLRELRDSQQRFDVIVLDPPAFIKRRKDEKAGLQAYRRINELAMGLLADDGILVSASCSFHLEESALQKVLTQSAQHARKNLQILERGRQGVDHPVHPAMPETEYLKALFCRLYSAG
ncbi:MAG: class I SAM-dependent rRNA methyltransferase [Gammaproteobacteria bacterium]